MCLYKYRDKYISKLIKLFGFEKNTKLKLFGFKLWKESININVFIKFCISNLVSD